MKNRKFSFIYLSIIILIIAVLVVFITGKFSDYKKDKNLHNIGNYQDIQNDIESKGIAIFDEYVLENFGQVELTIDNFRVYRADSIIEGTNNFEATENANRLLTLLENTTISLKEQNKDFHNKLKDNIFKGKINHLNINYFNGLNSNIDLQNNSKDYLNNYLRNKSVSFDDSGYLMSFIDGYESLLNVDSIDQINESVVLDLFNNKSAKIKGLKFVNNKNYYVLAFVENIEYLNKANIATTHIEINGKSYRASLFKNNLLKEGSLLTFKLFEGIENVILDRFIDLRISLGTFKGFKVPKSSIIKGKTIDGVYFIDNGKITFAPVKIMKELDREYIISTSLERALPSFIDIEKTNFKELVPFSKIIIDPTDYIEGDRY